MPGGRRALAIHRKKKKQEAAKKGSRKRKVRRRQLWGGGDAEHRSFRKSERIEAVWIERGEGGERRVASVCFFTRL